MVSAPPKPRSSVQPRLIVAPSGDPRLLEPGWPGELTDLELRFIQELLFADSVLSRQWGFRPAMRTRAESAIRRIAIHGDPFNLSLNRKLARAPAATMGQFGAESSNL